MITTMLCLYGMISIGFGAQSYSCLRRVYGKQDHVSTICAAVIGGLTWPIVVGSIIARND